MISLLEKNGRQMVRREPGMFFALVSGHRRGAYLNLNGELVLADECKCRVEWTDAPGFSIERNLDCPIDEHRYAALKLVQEKETTGTESGEAKRLQ